MAIKAEDYKKYLVENKSLVLATVGEDQTPQVRHIGGYNLDGNDIVFLTGKDTTKTKEIAKNNHVTLLFQQEGQSAPKNITVYGVAEELIGEEAVSGAKLVTERRPQLTYDKEKNKVYRVKAEKIKVLDFASQEKIQNITAGELA